MKRFALVFLIPFSLMLASCGAQQGKAELDYEQSKQMMIDVLKTDEGKKALMEILADDKAKQHLVIESEVVKTTISESLVSKEGQEMWQKLFADPKFLDNFLTAIAKEQEKMLKHLMNDAEFQKKMLELMQNPEMEEQTLKVLTSQKFKEHLEKSIIETIENPIFQTKILKATEKQDEEKSEEENKKQEDGGQGQEQGGGGQ